MQHVLPVCREVLAFHGAGLSVKEHAWTRTASGIELLTPKGTRVRSSGGDRSDQRGQRISTRQRAVHVHAYSCPGGGALCIPTRVLSAVALCMSTRVLYMSTRVLYRSPSRG